MISTPTVFVLGAGASQPYGFPVGTALASDVMRRLEDKGSELRNRVVEVCRELKQPFNPEDWQQLPRHFDESGCSTIDEFLLAAGNRRFLYILKVVMAVALIECEREQNLYPDSRARRAAWERRHSPEPFACRDWAAYLFDHMRTPTIDTFEQNQVRVITFNFDRSFERKLFLMLRGSYGLTDHEAGVAQGTVKVVHLHGALGGQHWLGERRPESREYEPSATNEHLVEATRSITIVHEEIAASHVLDTVRDWLQWARTICFLGFGFHPTNMERLNLSTHYRYASMWGTAFGLSAPEIERVRRRFNQEQRPNLFPEHDAYGLLRRTPVLG